MFLLKKIIASILLPIPLVLIISGFGLFLLWFTKWQRFGKLLVGFAVIGLLVMSSTPFSNYAISTLENSFAPFDVEKKTVKYVMVLGSGHVSDAKLPVTSQIGSVSLIRLVEGIRIYQANPGSKLILSGYGGKDPVSNAEVVAKVAVALGIARSDLIESANARDTFEEARLIKEVIGNAVFALVTSANHMPRSMAVFTKQGLSPIPAPANYLVKKSPNKDSSWEFSAGNLYKTERAMHEYLGLAWYKLRGNI